jgi:hypothetical protein
MLEKPGRRFGAALAPGPRAAAAVGSATAPDAPTVGAAALVLAPSARVAPRGVAHFPQNAASGGLSAPHRAHARTRGAAQCTQNAIPSEFSRAQRGQETLIVMALVS